MGCQRSHVRVVSSRPIISVGKKPCRMKPKLSIITLGVEDLARAKAFYERLGFSYLAEESNDRIAFFALEGAASRLALFSRASLAEDVGVSANGSGFRGCTLAHNVSTPEAVDRVLAEAVAAGATLVKPGQPVFWGGYSGYFADPDGFLWEIAHNPFTDLT